MTTPVAPGVQIISRATPPVRGGAAATGTWHIAALAERGPTNQSVLLSNLSDYDKHYGARVSYGQRDAVEAHFRNGGGNVNLIRIVGPAATVATVALPGAAGVASIAVDAIGAGVSTLSADVDVSGSTFTLNVFEGSKVLQASPPLDSVDAAVSWSQSSPYIRVRALGAALPLATVSPVPLAGGADDRAAVTDVHRIAALNLIPRGDGPGQVSIPGATTTDAHVALARHAVANNRFAMADLPNSSSEADLLAVAAAFRTGTNDLEEGHLFFCEGWQVIPGITIGTTRTVPPSAINSALMAKRDALTGNPNEPAAGLNGVPSYTLGPVRPNWGDGARARLNGAGINVYRYVSGEHRLYGYRTAADPLGAGAVWINAGNARLRMAIQARAEELGEAFVFAQITKSKISEYNGIITGLLLDYFNKGALFGDVPEEAFVVDTGPQVNTSDLIAARRLSAVAGVRMSEFSEVVYMEFVKVAITEAIS